MNEKDCELHTNRKKCRDWYKCKECDFSTPFNTNLRVHARKHNGERPFKCNCGFAAATPTNLKIHLDNGHRNDAMISVNGIFLGHIKLPKIKPPKEAKKLPRKYCYT